MASSPRSALKKIRSSCSPEVIEQDTGAPMDAAEWAEYDENMSFRPWKPRLVTTSKKTSKNLQPGVNVYGRGDDERRVVG